MCLFEGKFTELYVPGVENVPIVLDGYLYSLNPKGIDVIDVKESNVLEIENSIAVASVLCYNKHTKMFLSKKNNSNLVLSRIVNKS